MQYILESQAADEKMKLLAIQALRELAKGGYHTALLESSVL